MPQSDNEPDAVTGIDRRRFLQLGGFGALTVARPDLVAATPDDRAAPQAPIVPRAEPDHRVVLRRRGDQLRLTLDFWNLQLVTTGGPPRMVKVSPTAAAFVVVHFLPQHVAEEAFYEPAPLTDDPQIGEPVEPPPIGHRVAGGSRLAFEIPAAQLPLAYTWQQLLTWHDWIPSVVPVALAAPEIEPVRGRGRPPALRAPRTKETALELPWWLLLSTHRQSAWVHELAEVTHAGRTELWHTRLAGKPPQGDVDEFDQVRKTVRAVWTRDPTFTKYLNSNADPAQPAPPDGEDFPNSPIGMPFRTALSPRDRFDLVVSTADFSHRHADPGYVPRPAEVEQLMLSSTGAWADLRGTWTAAPQPDSSNTSLESWRHIATGGRDQYVRIVRAGAMCSIPFGAALFKVTERVFRTIGSGTRNDPKRRIAYLVQRYFIVLRQRELVLDGPFQRDEGRGFPFSRVRARTLVTPTLDPPPQVPDVPGIATTLAFVPRVGGEPYLFDLEGIDRAGDPIDLAVPLVFVDGTIVTNSLLMGDLRDWYNGLSPEDPRRAAQLDGQLVAAAPPGDRPNSTDVEVHRFTLGAQAPRDGTEDDLTELGRPLYFPTMAEAEIRFAAAENVGDAPLGGPTPVVVLDPTWVGNGFGPLTPGEVFVQLKDLGNPAQLNFAGTAKGDRGGGVVTPNIGVTALSRVAGVVGGDPATFQGGTFDPTAFFGSLKANLLGDLALGQVIEDVTGGDFLTDPAKLAQVVKLRSRTEPDAVVTELAWQPALKNWGPFIKSSAAGEATLDLRATITTPTTPSAPATSVVIGDLRNFTIRLLEGTSARFLDVEFNRLRFQAETGKPADVDVEIREVAFTGCLQFVNQLRDYLDFSAGGFSIDVQPTQLVAGFELPLPSIPLGVFSLQNIAFNAGVTIPFTGKPIRLRFGFSSLDNPFLVSVMIFGGGGFFELGIGTDGVESFQASLEFGIVGALDFGIASGSVSVTAGIYLAIGVPSQDNPDGKTELTGFIKIKGEVEVLGLISLGIFMKASFTYIPKKAIVRATIIVEVDVFPFSAEVEIEYEKKFGGSEDPTFRQSLDAAQWDEYASAFAPIGA